MSFDPNWRKLFEPTESGYPGFAALLEAADVGGVTPGPHGDVTPGPHGDVAQSKEVLC